MLSIALVLAASYLIGGIPFSYLFVRLLKGVDLREIGSGNVGATNASRLFPRPWSFPAFLVCFLLDAAKGFIPAWYGGRLLADVELFHGMADSPLASPATLILLAGIFAVLGHIYTPYLRFKGGKGVATSLGVFLAAAPIAVIVALTAGLGVMGLTRYVSLGSCVIGAALPAMAIWRQPGEYALWALSIGVGAFIIIRHRSNLRRIARGEEARLFTKEHNLAKAERSTPREAETKP